MECCCERMGQNIALPTHTHRQTLRVCVSYTWRERKQKRSNEKLRWKWGRRSASLMVTNKVSAVLCTIFTYSFLPYVTSKRNCIRFGEEKLLIHISIRSMVLSMQLILFAMCAAYLRVCESSTSSRTEITLENEHTHCWCAGNESNILVLLSGVHDINEKWDIDRDKIVHIRCSLQLQASNLSLKRIVLLQPNIILIAMFFCYASPRVQLGWMYNTWKISLQMWHFLLTRSNFSIRHSQSL